MIKIIVVDDHDIFSKGLVALLGNVPDFEIIASYQNATTFLESLPSLDLDILLLDIQLPDKEPVEILQTIRKTHPELKIIYLTLLRGNRIFHKLEPFGFQGYILKDEPLETLVKAIQKVYHGESFYSPLSRPEQTQNTVTQPENKILQLLSKREREVLMLIAQELSSSEIAARLFVSVSTVDSHRKNLMQKLGVDNIVGLVKFAVQNNLI